MAEDAVKVAPDVYKVLFENEKVRVLEVEMEEGSGTEMHSHPDTLIYIISGGKVTFTNPFRRGRRSRDGRRRNGLDGGHRACNPTRFGCHPRSLDRAEVDNPIARLR